MAAQKPRRAEAQGAAGGVHQQAARGALLDVESRLEIEVEPPAGRRAPLLAGEGADDPEERADGPARPQQVQNAGVRP